MSKLYITNSSILTNPGEYSYKIIDINEAKKLVEKKGNFISAIGHVSTANILTSLLNIKIPYNRISIQLNAGDQCLVFKLKERLEEGKIYKENELEKIGFEIGLLTRKK
ncbi:MAG: YddF family protein [Chlorobi bacterium]|nr:YddF family protein [Chlorobiota bacterium]